MHDCAACADDSRQIATAAWHTVRLGLDIRICNALHQGLQAITFEPLCHLMSQSPASA